ncbi:MAG: hypothetical protein ACYDG6_14515 [Thermincolia bacterium]
MKVMKGMKKPDKGKTKIKPKGKKSTAVLSPHSDAQWRIQEDANTLKRAAEIKSDPKRMKDAKTYCAKEIDALKQVSNMKM